MISSGNISTSNRNDSGLSRKRIVSAAGRMVKEGDKSYTYGYLDKVLAVRENDKKIASFDYQVDGQIAQAIHGDQSEAFFWDGLALIHRGETSFINEPYVTGGNPILSSKQGVMFTDMLGSTLNIGGKAIHMTAFGETKDTDALFTGKPYIGELGYAFLFRNYRADKGKWQTSDPLGYPDGWNNFAYCNNMASFSIDFAGAWNLWKWLYTGDGNASDTVYNAAVAEAGASYYDGLQSAIAGMPVLGTALNYYGQTNSWVGWDGSTALAQSVSSDPLVKLFADSFKTNLQKTIEMNKKAGTFSETSQLLTLDTGTTFDLGSALILGRFYVNASASWTVSHVENNKYRYSGTINYTINDQFDFDLKVRILSLGLLEFGKPFDVNVNWTDTVNGYFYE